MAGKVLKDLNIQSIKLLTNNPAKVSHLAKYGIRVIERVPLIIKPNKHNRRYFNTKKSKFTHSFSEKLNQYFYQFHADTEQQVQSIGEYLLDKRNDPLLQICVGITTDDRCFIDAREMARIAMIDQICRKYNFTSVVHYSFRKSNDISQDIEKLKKALPFIGRLQLNDLPVTEMSHLKFGFNHFTLDIPFCDANFSRIHDKAIQNLIMQKEAFVLLDNSKGRGIQEPKDILMKKIETLLNYGINRIALFGGFGPDELQTFFEMRKYYHINFSIDAETKLKTMDTIDIEKTKRYLLQLMVDEERAII
jgi:hypothetical protein